MRRTEGSLERSYYSLSISRALQVEASCLPHIDTFIYRPTPMRIGLDLHRRSTTGIGACFPSPCGRSSRAFHVRFFTSDLIGANPAASTSFHQLVESPKAEEVLCAKYLICMELLLTPVPALSFALIVGIFLIQEPLFHFLQQQGIREQVHLRRIRGNRIMRGGDFPG